MQANTHKIRGLVTSPTPKRSRKGSTGCIRKSHAILISLKVDVFYIQCVDEQITVFQSFSTIFKMWDGYPAESFGFFGYLNMPPPMESFGKST